jgi:hypothetical protein
MKNKLIILGLGAMLSAATQSAQAQLAIAGAFNGWDNTGVPAPGTDPANPLITTNIMTGGSAGSYHEFKFIKNSGDWGATFPNNNVKLKYDASGSNTVYFYTNAFNDGWLPTANRVGYNDPGNMAFEIVGDFNGWSSVPAGQLGLKPGSNGLYTNIFIVPAAGGHSFKFRTPGTWDEVQFGADFGNGSGDAGFVTTTPNEAILFQLDLPNGRWQAGGPPVYANVTFSVDMSVVRATDAGFDPASVTVNGSMNDWSAASCTNNPNAANTNVYTSPSLSILAGTGIQYQFRYTSGGNTVYDALNGVGGQNRTYSVPPVASTNLPAVYFNDALPLDILNVDTTVTFSVSMTNAVGTDTHFFDGSQDLVFINGDFSGWQAWSPIALTSAGLTLANDPPGSGIYTFTKTFTQGSPRAVTYKYSINGADNEAGFGQNHFRYIRSTNGVYNMPLDVFQNMVVEAKVGALSIGAPAGGSVPVTWQGYPSVRLQSATSLNGPWTDVANTDTQNSASLPISGGAQFFRLKKP